MKQFLCLLITVCLISGLYAQGAMPVILISKKGKVCYQSPAKKGSQKAIAGAVFKRDGQVKLSKRSAATFYCDGKFIQQSGKNQLDLTALFPKGESMAKDNFDLSFGDYTISAFQMAASTSDARDGWGNIDKTKGTADGWGNIDKTKGTADGWGNIDKTKGTADGWGNIDKTKGTADGWGGKGKSIAGIQPVGRINSKSVLVSWSKPAGMDPFHVVIADSDGNMVMETTTKDTFWLIEAQEAAFKSGLRYDWTVETVGEKPIKSSKVAFEVGTMEALEAAKAAAKKGDLFAMSPPEIQLIMEAVALEKTGWFAEAAAQYKKAQQMAPKNEYVKLMHAAFWTRWGFTPKARAVYR